MPTPTIPKLRIPLRVENGRMALVEQDSPDNIAACVYAILAYERGSRIEDPEFGVENPSFSQFPFDDREWLEQIARYEPRASVETQQEIEDTIGAILVEVGLLE
jgi:phage baseplate assembly protein W